MEESEDNMSSEDVRKLDSPSAVKKPKKRSLVERELETNLTARVTSPAAIEGFSTSRYGRARRLKTDTELIESQKVLLASIKSPGNENTPVKVQSPVYRMHASNSPHKAETPKNASATHIDNQIDNIYQENISLSRFSDETLSSPAKKYPKVYIRKDLIQNREEEEPVMLIKNLFSPTKSASKLNTSLRDNSVHSPEKYNANQNGHVDNSSVVKTLDFDSNKKKRKDDKEKKAGFSKNELFDLEAKCPYQVGDLAWARVGTFPFWPCIVTRDPYSEMFVKKKLFGRVEHDIVHVTFFGDNGRRSWIVDNMLRKYSGQLEFESTREKFTAEDKKKDPRLYAAFFVSEKKQALWNMSVEEAETLLREPKRLRIDIFNDMLWKSRASKKLPKSGKISSRTNSDVSLSESLYDSLFSEKEAKADEKEPSKKSRNKSFDVSEVVTACLDNMAAKTGITKIQRQSHMDRWLQKAKSKTPEKTQAKPAVLKLEKQEKVQIQSLAPIRLTRKSSSKINIKPSIPSSSLTQTKPHRFGMRTESHSKLIQNESKNHTNIEGTTSTPINDNKSITKSDDNCDLNITKPPSHNVDEENNSSPDFSTAIIIIDEDNTAQTKNYPKVQNPDEPVNDSALDTREVKQVKAVADNETGAGQITSAIKSIDDDLNESKDQADVESTTNETNDTFSIEAKLVQSLQKETVNISSVDETTVAANELNAAIINRPIQDARRSKTVEVVKETSSASIPDSTNNSQTSNTHPIKVSKRSSNTSVELYNKTSVSNATQDSVMEVDENTNDIETVQDKREKSFFCEPANERTNFGSQTNEDASPNSENVSNKSVEDNVVTDSKEAQNVVTIEVSVTEKNNDDTLNDLPQGGEQESIDKLNPKVDTLNFLDKSNMEGIAETNYLIDPKNSSTPEVYEKYETKNKKSSKISTRRLNLECEITNSISDNTFHKKNEFIVLKDDTDKNDAKNVHIENIVSIDDVATDNDQTMESKTDVLNESTTSESILLLCTDNPEIKKGEEILEIAFSDSIKPESILESIPINTNENVSMKEKSENAENLSVEKVSVADGIQQSSTRPYVESPTFTQLLDSEEFFRDVNDTHNTYTKPEIDNSKQYRKTQKITPSYEIEKSTKSDEGNNVIDDFHEDDDVTSEDEPSPEYESLDDEITEDFRKHMMSIKSNIKDKKDEDQIVKICNEIAEKAKLSPTKYNQHEEIAKTIEKTDTKSRNVPLTSPKEKLDVAPQDNNAVHKEKVNTSPYDEQHTKLDTHYIALDGFDIKKQNKLKESHTESTKDLNQSYRQTKDTIQPDVVPEKHEDTKIKINGKSALHEISDKPKIFYKTRSSGSSATKQRASPPIKIESSKIEQYRRSCEYEPKVVIIRLERDKIDYSIGSSKSKPLDEEKSKNYNKSRKSLGDSPDDKNMENEEDKNRIRKSRLSLRRDIHKSKETENKSMKISEIILDKSANLTPELSKKEEIVIAASKVPKKIEMYTRETGIPEHVKVNGYRHNIDRKFTDTPDLIGDTDFDVDAVSLNSEDSEVSLPNSTDSLPKRSLRSRPERTLEYALKNPEFLKYLELRQDYLMDLHPELNEEEVVTYVHKTWQYEEDLKSDAKKIDDVRNNLKLETPRNKKSKKSQPKDSIENCFREKYEKSRKTIDFDSETGTIESSIKVVEQNAELNDEENMSKTDIPGSQREHSEPPNYIDPHLKPSNDTFIVEDKCKDAETVLVKYEENLTNIRISPKSLDKKNYDVEGNPKTEEKSIKEREIDTESVNSEDSEIPLRQLRSRALKENNVSGLKQETSPEKEVGEVSANKEHTLNNKIKNEADETASTVSDNEPLVKQKKKRTDKNSIDDPGFIQYLELRQDALMDENPQLTHAEIVQYLHKIWLYEENSKTALEKNDELEQEANLVKGLNNNEFAPSKKVRRRPKIQKQTEDFEDAPKEKPRRRIAQPFYNENYSDIEEELEVFEIFKTKKSAITVVSKAETEKNKSPNSKKESKESPKDTTQTEQVENEPENDDDGDVEYVDEIELYFTELTKPKPNIFKGLIREKVCEICESVGGLVKCKGCYGMFHPDCAKRQSEPIEKVEESESPSKGRKKKRKSIRKPKSLEDSESHSDDRSLDVSADTSVDEIVPPEIRAIDADYFESQLEIKMKEILEAADIEYESYSSDDAVDWAACVAGRCEIVDVKRRRRRPPADYADFRCAACACAARAAPAAPACFVCRSPVSKTAVEARQKCHVAHCHKYYHLECLDHWPQTQFNSGEPSRNNKKKNEFFEALTCPRHVCHSCVSDDPRGCKTRFSGDKLAKCVRCPATYHSFNKCLPAGSRVLTASHIVCPRHTEQKAGKVPRHVNTGWCFICALGGSLICCEYCPTSFHAECLNIQPPDGNYMCEDCETGRLPLYGEMVWVKLGQYRWWPGIILHPSEIPENIMLVKHELGEFVVRFFGQYDHYWVNRGRVFPYQEGDSGRISSQKSKINADFILAIEHAQRAYTILKNAQSDEEESLDIASSLLPPHYVKLKSNKASGSLCGKKIDDPSLSLTQCECNPDEPDPCGPYSQCLNRMLLTECGPTCRAAERCNNRAFEKRLYPRLVPYRTKHRGWGLKTLQHIRAGQFVIEYVGELIDEEEFRRRMRRKHEIRDENFYFLTLDKERMIDAGPKGNVARFMNHCCEPNCETQKWTVLGDVRVGLFAIDDIPANSEVTFNYNLECTGIEKKRCLCGATRCSGYIGAKPKQDESQTKKGKERKLKRTYNKKKKPDEPLAAIKIKKKLGRPPKPKELTDLEKDVLIIKNATNLSSDESTKSEDKNTTTKKKISIPRDQVSLCSGQEGDKTKSLKRKRVSISTDEVSIFNEQEPCVKKQKCDKPSEVGD